MADEVEGPIIESDISYLRCERDVFAWLVTQVPVPVCQELAQRVLRGEHRGRAVPDLDRQWEIPITLGCSDPIHVQHLKMLIRSLGGELCISDETGKYVVVPMFRPVEEVQSKLKYVDHILSVGAALRFVNNRREPLREALVHIMWNGVTLCGYPTGFPKDWPEGLYVARNDGDVMDEATCDRCRTTFIADAQVVADA